MKFVMNVFYCSMVIVLLAIPESFSQSISKLKEFKVRGVERLTVDRLGNFFLVLKNGTIKKYDSEARLIASTKAKKGSPTLIEPWYDPSIFVYNGSAKEWTVYDRELQNPQVSKLDPSVAIYPYLVCPTNDNKLLVFDKADYSVKKINRFTSEVLFEFRIDTLSFSKPLDISFMRDYQNMIFLLDRNSGILIFNNIGKLINRIGTAGIQNFGFYGEELFYPEAKTINLYDLYSEKTRLIPLERQFCQLCITDERVIGIDCYNNVFFYQFSDIKKE
jgi:hypothetical protein